MLVVVLAFNIDVYDGTVVTVYFYSWACEAMCKLSTEAVNANSFISFFIFWYCSGVSYLRV